VVCPGGPPVRGARPAGTRVCPGRGARRLRVAAATTGACVARRRRLGDAAACRFAPVCRWGRAAAVATRIGRAAGGRGGRRAAGAPAPSATRARGASDRDEPPCLMRRAAALRQCRGVHELR